MQCALYLQSTFLDMMCSVAARYLPRSVLKLRHAETSLCLAATCTSSSRSRSFQENVTSWMSDSSRAHDNVPNDISTDTDAKADLIPTFAVRMRIIPCTNVTVVDLEHNLMHKTRSVSTEFCVKWAQPQRTAVVAMRKIASVQNDRLESDVGPSLFWDVTQRRLVVSCQRFRTTSVPSSRSKWLLYLWIWDW
jgi:hypothetical protein